MAKVSPAQLTNMLRRAGMPEQYIPAAIATARAESKFDTSAKNRDSTASSVFQFVDDTYKEQLAYYRQHRPDIARYMESAGKDDPQSQSYALTSYWAKIASTAQRNGLPLTPATIYVGHHQGAQGMVDYYTASADAHPRAIMGNDVVNANASLFDVPTMGQARAQFASFMQSNGIEGDGQYMNANFSPAAAGTPPDSPFGGLGLTNPDGSFNWKKMATWGAIGAVAFMVWDTMKEMFGDFLGTLLTIGLAILAFTKLPGLFGGSAQAAEPQPGNGQGQGGGYVPPAPGPEGFRDASYTPEQPAQGTGQPQIDPAVRGKADQAAGATRLPVQQTDGASKAPGVITGVPSDDTVTIAI